MSKKQPPIILAEHGPELARLRGNEKILDRGAIARLALEPRRQVRASGSQPDARPGPVA